MTYRDVYNTLTKEASLDKKALMSLARYQRLAKAVKPINRIRQAVNTVIPRAINLKGQRLIDAGLGMLSERAGGFMQRLGSGLNRFGSGLSDFGSFVRNWSPERHARVKRTMEDIFEALRTRPSSYRIRRPVDIKQAPINTARQLPALPAPKAYTSPVTYPFNYTGRRRVRVDMNPKELTFYKNKLHAGNPNIFGDNVDIVDRNKFIGRGGVVRFAGENGQFAGATQRIGGRKLRDDVYVSPVRIATPQA